MAVRRLVVAGPLVAPIVSFASRTRPLARPVVPPGPFRSSTRVQPPSGPIDAVSTRTTPADSRHTHQHTPPHARIRAPRVHAPHADGVVASSLSSVVVVALDAAALRSPLRHHPRHRSGRTRHTPRANTGHHDRGTRPVGQLSSQCGCFPTDTSLHTLFTRAPPLLPSRGG